LNEKKYFIENELAFSVPNLVLDGNEREGGPVNRVAIWPFLKLFARNKVVWPFGHFLAFFGC